MVHINVFKFKESALDITWKRSSLKAKEKFAINLFPKMRKIKRTGFKITRTTLFISVL